MVFSLKQLLAIVLVVSVGLAALANADKPLIVGVVRLLTLMVLVLAAYSVWTSEREARAFRIGFVCWGGVYFLIHVAPRIGDLNLGTDMVLSPILGILQPDAFERDRQGVITGVHETLYAQFFYIGHCLLTFLFGLIGGWVTVYFYRKRQRMQKTNP